MARWMVLIFGLAQVSAQPAGQISGVVHDPSGAVIGGANISAVHMHSGLRRIGLTDGSGSYAFSSLPPGEYKVSVRKPGFRTVARLGIMLAAGDAARLDFDLQIGGMQEFLTIEGGNSSINLEDATSGVVVEGEAARRMAVNGRTLHGYLPLAPGVLATPATLGEAGQFSVNGQRPNANYFVTDGVSANSGVGGAGLPGQFSGGTLPAMTALGTLHGVALISEVREIQVKTSTFAPEFGRMPGAQVQVNTLTGSNDFHGEALYSFRHERLARTNYFARRAGIDTLPLRMQDGSLSAGGPVQQDRMFFFGSLEILRLRQPSASLLPGVPQSASGSLLDLFPRSEGSTTAVTAWPGSVTSGSFRMDSAVGSGGLLFARYHESASANKIGYVQENDSDFRTRSFTAGVTHSPSASMVNDARLNVSRTAVESAWAPGLGEQTARLAMKNLFVLPQGLQPRTVYGVAIEGLGQVILGSREKGHQDQFQLVDTLAVSKGRHQIRTGIDYLRLTPSRERPISSAVARFDGIADVSASRTPMIVYGDAPSGSSLIENVSAFAQDTWSLNERLNLTYGVRWEYMPPPSSRNVQDAGTPVVVMPGGSSGPTGPSIVPEPTPSSAIVPVYAATPDWSSRFGRLAPRFGLAYRLGADQDLVLRAGAGVFYDLGFASAIDPLNSIPFNSWRTMTTAGGEAQGTAPVYGFARDLRIPYSWQWNMTVEGRVPVAGIVSAGWVGSLGRNLLRREGFAGSGAGIPGVVLGTSNGRSSYQAFQAHVRRQSKSGLRWIGSYTWSHSIDNGSWDAGSYMSGAQDRGASNFDVRHSFAAGLDYDLPRGWSLHGIAHARSGFPIDVLVRDNAFGLGFDNLRPDLVPGAAWNGDQLNRFAFATPAGGRQGSLGRNAIRGFGMAQLDAAVERTFRSGVSVRMQVYNVTNTRALADPVRTLSNPLFGQSVSTMDLMFGTGRPTSGVTPAFQTGGPRTVELSARWRF